MSQREAQLETDNRRCSNLIVVASVLLPRPPLRSPVLLQSSTCPLPAVTSLPRTLLATGLTLHTIHLHILVRL